MFFSVIIPTYNRADMLRETLESVFAQTFEDYEVIVVDDGSTDHTVEILRGYPRVKVLTQTNRGPGAARNHGVSRSSGQYLAFLDSDDLWFPWTLGVYQQVALQHASPGFITGTPLVFTTDAKLPGTRDKDVSVESLADYYASSDNWHWFGTPTFVIRKDVFLAVGGFQEKGGMEDAHLAMKLGCSPGFVHIQQPQTFAYRNHVNSLKDELNYQFSGAMLLITSERNGDFPGGPTRARERWRILTRHIRPVMLECLKRGRRREAWDLYRATFSWHLRLGRWKCLAGFPLMALFGKAR
ncbi:MAG: glycosyltransferase family 2 protein [Methylacidiphilales bacterium]|nr:glycosyltransferase family 2 protein [Candidatus Methylacidiphilales bacterium]